MMEMKEKCCVC